MASRKPFPGFSAQALKRLSAASLCLVNIGAVVIERGIIGLDRLSGEELLAAMDRDPNLVTLAGAASMLQLLAGLASPIFAFLLVEGFLHTRSYKKYLLRVTVLALVSELAFDLARSGTLLEFSRQNPALALAVCLVELYCLRMAERLPSVERWIVSLLVTLAAAFWTLVLHAEFGLNLVLLTAVLYCFREKQAWRLLLGVLVSLLEPLGPLAFCFIAFYNGKRQLKLPGSVYYALYPAQLLLLALITRFL